MCEHPQCKKSSAIQARSPDAKSTKDTMRNSAAMVLASVSNERERGGWGPVRGVRSGANKIIVMRLSDRDNRILPVMVIISLT